MTSEGMEMEGDLVGTPGWGHTVEAERCHAQAAVKHGRGCQHISVVDTTAIHSVQTNMKSIPIIEVGVGMRVQVLAVVEVRVGVGVRV